MARIRTIKPEFWSSSKVGKVSRDARLLFLGLLNEADDEGRLLGQTKRLAGILFPYDEDIDAGTVAELLKELASVGLVQKYDVSGACYLSIRGFSEHQKIDKRQQSRLPPPPPIPPLQLITSIESAGPADYSGEPADKSGLEQGTGNREAEREVEGERVVVVEDNLSFGSFLSDDIRATANLLRDELPLDQQKQFCETIWKLAFVALTLGDGDLVDNIIRSSKRSKGKIDHHADYFAGAIRKACEKRSQDFELLKSQAPPCSPDFVTHANGVQDRENIDKVKKLRTKIMNKLFAEDRERWGNSKQAEIDAEIDRRMKPPADRVGTTDQLQSA